MPWKGVASFFLQKEQLVLVKLIGPLFLEKSTTTQGLFLFFLLSMKISAAKDIGVLLLLPLFAFSNRGINEEKVQHVIIRG